MRIATHHLSDLHVRAKATAGFLRAIVPSRPVLDAEAWLQARAVPDRQRYEDARPRRHIATHLERTVGSNPSR